jgi:Thiol:disulfide interchange protein
MIDQWLNQIAMAVRGNAWFVPLLTLLAGVLTSVTPCSLSNVPLIVGYVGGIGEKNTKRAFSYSALFALGTALTFVTMGIIATSAGRLMGNTSRYWYIILGILMVLMAFQTWGVINIIPSANLITKNKKRGYVGAFLAGILGGIFSSPCSTPVLIALLAILAGSNGGGSNLVGNSAFVSTTTAQTAASGGLMWGILLMLMYSIGHSALVMVAGTSVGFVQKINASEKYNKAATISKNVMGIVILLIGVYMFRLAF